MNTCVSSAWREWRSAMDSGRMHHAWLLTGPRGLGKGGFARTAARELVAEPGVPQPDVGVHPDIIVLAPLPENEEEAKKRDEGKPFRTKRNIAIDQIRGMQQRLITRPTLGARRAIVIDPADDMEKGAVNALLKSLEEPPIGTFFLLVTHQPGRLVATVRSRCRVLRFPPLTEGELGQVLGRERPEADTDTHAGAIAAAQGSPGAALAFVNQDLGRVHALMQRIVRDGDASGIDFTDEGVLQEGCLLANRCNETFGHHGNPGIYIGIAKQLAVGAGQRRHQELQIDIGAGPAALRRIGGLGRESGRGEKQERQ